MDALKTYLLNQPQNLKPWLDQFPWDSFADEVIIHENKVEKIAIAEKVILQTDAEVTGLLICRQAEIGEGAEILGTMVCDTGRLGIDAECNYFIGRIVVLSENAEIRSAIVADSLQMENGAEVDELETLDYTNMILQDESLIKSHKKLSIDEYQSAINQRLQIVLESAISQLT